jgi:hypothetical protein
VPRFRYSHCQNAAAKIVAANPHIPPQSLPPVDEHICHANIQDLMAAHTSSEDLQAALRRAEDRCVAHLTNSASSTAGTTNTRPQTSDTAQLQIYNASLNSASTYSLGNSQSSWGTSPSQFQQQIAVSPPPAPAITYPQQPAMTANHPQSSYSTQAQTYNNTSDSPTPYPTQLPPPNQSSYEPLQPQFSQQIPIAMRQITPYPQQQPATQQPQAYGVFGAQNAEALQPVQRARKGWGGWW